jgi:hypothetical protein
MAENPHYKELLQLLNEFEVEYLIVGGFAVMKYGEPRYTKDLDVWVHNSPENSRCVLEALKKFGAPLEHDGITAETFTGQVVYQIGIAPVSHSRNNQPSIRKICSVAQQTASKQVRRENGRFHEC